MQPPFHVTGNPNADWIIFFGGALFCMYWLRALRLAREGARLFLRNLLHAAIVFCLSLFVLSAIRARTDLMPSQEQGISVLLALLFLGQQAGRRRSRYIPKSVARAVIARDLKGE